MIPTTGNTPYPVIVSPAIMTGWVKDDLYRLTVFGPNLDSLAFPDPRHPVLAVSPIYQWNWRIDAWSAFDLYSEPGDAWNRDAFNPWLLPEGAS